MSGWQRQRRERHRPRRIEPRAGCGEQVKVFAPERGRFEVTARARLVEDADIDPPAQQPFMDIGADALDDLEPHLGIGAAEVLGERPGKDEADRGRHAERYLAGHVAGLRRHVGAGLLDLAQDAGGPVEKDRAGAGQGNAASMADEKLGLELRLEQPDLPAERRLGDVKPVCRLAEAAELGDVNEGAKLPDVHAAMLARNSIVAWPALKIWSSLVRSRSGTARQADRPIRPCFSR